MTDKDELIYEEWFPDALKAFHELRPWGNPKEWGQVVWNHLMAIIETRNQQLAVYTFHDSNGEAVSAEWQQEHIDTLLERIATLEAQLQEKD